MTILNRTRIHFQSLTFTFLTAISSFSVFSEQDSVAGADSKSVESCAYSKSTPIIPDGNIATKDELISAQTRIKVYQESLQNFRDCLLIVEQTLDVDSEKYESAKAALIARSNESVLMETNVADEFNSAIKIYKAR